ncbi:MAG: LamG-like jellyroll fold domain-containing protein [Opitutae bacterium]
MKQADQFLIDRYFQGNLSEKDKIAINQLLDSSREARDYFRKAALLDSVLHEKASLPLPEIASHKQPHPMVPWLVAAACMVLALIAWSKNLSHNYEYRGQKFTSTNTPQTQPIAHLIDFYKAEFSSQHSPNDLALNQGLYELKSGFIELRFKNNARILMEGPATFFIEDELNMNLTQGKVRAVIPQTAHGFTVRTEDADFVDLGTEFFVFANPAKKLSQVDVLSGEVNVVKPASQELLKNLKYRQSAQLDSGILKKSPFANKADLPIPGQLATYRWLDRAKELARDRSLIAYFPMLSWNSDEIDAPVNKTGFPEEFLSKKILDWQRLRNFASNPRASHGVKGIASWSSGRWPKKYSQDFSSPFARIDFEIYGSFEEITIGAWVNINQQPNELTSILSSDGWVTPGKVHFKTNRAGGLHCSMPSINSLPTEYASTVVLNRWIFVSAQIQTNEAGTTSLCRANGLKTSLMKGPITKIEPGKVKMGNWYDDNLNKFERYLCGKIDELMIWDRCLSAEEIKNLYEAGKPEAPTFLAVK